MATPPRNPDSRRSSDNPAPDDDLFGRQESEAEAGTGAASSPPSSDAGVDDEWMLDEPAPSRAQAQPQPPAPRARPSILSAQPIMPPAASSFESNPDASREPVPSATPDTTRASLPPSPATASPRPAAAAVSAAGNAKAREADDAFEIDDHLPEVSSGSGSATSREKAETSSSPSASPSGRTAASMAEDPADTAASDDVAAPAPPVRPTGPRDRFGMAAAAAILLTLLGVFAGILYANRPASDAGPSRANPDLPLAGELITLSEVTSAWRQRSPGDLVSAVDVSLPAPSRVQPDFLPQVSFTVDAGATKTGFVRFIFLDGDRKIAGDVRLVKISGGNIEPLQSGAITTAPGTAVVYGSFGFMDRPGFVGYVNSDSQRWSVEVSESADANAKEEDWKRLETFDIRNSTEL